MNARERRRAIMGVLEGAKEPVSGSALAREVGVSRQVVVQDIALLRAENKEIMSTNKGYVLYKPQQGAEKARVRVFRVNHDTEHMLDELQTIVDYGGRILNVSIEHALYGQISVDLIINNRLDALEFVNQMAMSRDQPLKALTGGCHYHTVAADSEKNLDMIEMELQRKGYLV